MYPTARKTYFEDSVMIDPSADILPLTTSDIYLHTITCLHHNKQNKIVNYLYEEGWLDLDALDELIKLCPEKQ